MFFGMGHVGRQAIKAKAGGAIVNASPTLDLTFVDGSGTLDPRITFTRASTATYFDSSGVMQTAAMNVALGSSSFSASYWAFPVGGGSIAFSTSVAPDGTTTGSTQTKTGTAEGVFRQVITLPATNVTYCGSVFVKQGTSPYVSLAGVSGASSYPQATLRWSDLTLVQRTGPHAATGIGLIPAGNGWYRLWISSPNSTSATVTTFDIRACGDGAAVGVGDGTETGTVLIWGAQLEVGAAPTPYIPTTTAANGAPRFDYDPVTHALRGLLIEEARTNLLLNSATLGTQSVAVATAAYVLSFYGTGSITVSGVPGGTGTLVGTGALNRASLYLNVSAGTMTLTVTGTVQNAQLEAGNYATSYIPTTAAAATRSPDNCTIATGAWFNAALSTLGADYILVQPETLLSPSARTAVSISDGTATNLLRTFAQMDPGNGSNARAGAIVASAAVLGPSLGFSTYNTTNKLIGSWDGTNMRGSLNGGAVQSIACGMPAGLNVLTLGAAFTGSASRVNGWVQRIRYWPRALSDAEMQSVTT